MSIKNPTTVIALFGLPLWQQFGERGLLGKPYVRMGPMYSSIGLIQFEKGGLLGYGLRNNAELFGKFVLMQGSQYDEYDKNTRLEGGIKPLGTELLSNVNGEPSNFIELFLLPELKSVGIDLQNPDFVTGKKSSWVKEKISDPDECEQMTYYFFQTGASIGFFHSSLFRKCWDGTHKKIEQSEWEEAYKRKIVSTPVQQELHFSQEVSSVLSQAFNWCKGNPNYCNLNIEELAELKRLYEEYSAPEE